MKRKGVVYDVGRVMFFSWRPDHDPRLVRGELEIIARDLHCTAVKILGSGTGRHRPSPGSGSAPGREPTRPARQDR